MSKYAESPAIRINSWLTAGLRAEGIVPPVEDYMDETDSQNPYELPFMLPGQQTPENQTPYIDGRYEDLPYCVYTVAHRNAMMDIFFHCGQITYSFYSGDSDKLIEIMNYVYDLCKRWDWSAADCNAFFSENDTTNPFDFKTINFSTSAGPAPAGEDESSRQVSLVVIRFEATYEGSGRTGVEPFSGGLGMIN